MKKEDLESFLRERFHTRVQKEIEITGESYEVAELRLKEQDKERIRKEELEEAAARKAATAAVMRSNMEEQKRQAVKERLPLWPEAVRAVPNGVLRSALFGAIRKGRRRYLEREQIAAVDGVEISYTGMRLDQNDLDVWESVLHSVRHQALGSECHVTAYSLLKMMGKTDTGKNREILHTRIDRLRAHAVTIKNGRYMFMGGLINSAYKDEETNEWIIVICPTLKKLYSESTFTNIDWSVRHTLDEHQLAQWLHGFYASHAEPYPIKVETLHKLCGSETGEIRKFKQTLVKALNALQEASKAHGQAFRYEIRDGLVHVEKKGSRAQQRHLGRRRSSKKTVDKLSPESEGTPF